MVTFGCTRVVNKYFCDISRFKVIYKHFHTNKQKFDTKVKISVHQQMLNEICLITFHSLQSLL